MNKEEKEAIEILEEMLKNKEGIIKYHYWIGNKSIEAIETILNLIKKYEENYISKDVIRDKIKECQYWADDYWEGEREEFNLSLMWLEELLEEE